MECKKNKLILPLTLCIVPVFTSVVDPTDAFVGGLTDSILRTSGRPIFVVSSPTAMTFATQAWYLHPPRHSASPMAHSIYV